MKLTAILAICVLLLACSSPESQPVELEQSPNEEYQEELVIEEPVEESPIFDMATAIGSGVPTKCIVEEDGQTVTVYVQGRNMRMDASSDTHAIYDDEQMWAWTGTQGMTMKMSDIQKVAQMTGQPVESRDDVVQRQNANARCVEETPPAGAFTPPSDVEFQDFGAIMAQYGQYQQ